MPKFIMKKMIMNWVLVVVLFLIELRGKHHRYNIFFCVCEDTISLADRTPCAYVNTCLSPE